MKNIVAITLVLGMTWIIGLITPSVGLAQEPFKEPGQLPANPKATRAVAAWDVVPYQVINQPFNVGVVAFHETGCKVEFSVFSNDKELPGLTKTVEHPTLNPRTQVVEFWMSIDPKALPDGAFEVRATVVPLEAGMITRPLDPMPLYANANGSLKFGEPVWVDCVAGDDSSDGTETKPLKTIKAGIAKAPVGGTIYLKAGKDYTPQALGGGFKRDYWTTITAAPGVGRDDVEIGKGRPGTEKLLFRNVTLYSNPDKAGYNTILDGEQGKTIVWLDNCKLYNKKGRWEGGGDTFGNRYISYITGGLTTEMGNGPGATLMRDHKLIKICSDAFTGVKTGINCSVDDIDRGPTSAHPDFHQSHVGDPSKYNTVILYNVKGTNCISQGFFGLNLQDSAFVNCLFHKGDTVMYSQYSGHLDHVLFFHITLPNQTWLWRDSFRASNVYMINSIISKMSMTKGADVSDLHLLSNHFLTNPPEKAIQSTSGEALFANMDKLNFSLQPASPARTGGKPLQTVPADANGVLYDPQSPARGCYASPEATEK